MTLAGGGAGLEGREEDSLEAGVSCLVVSYTCWLVPTGYGTMATIQWVPIPSPHQPLPVSMEGHHTSATPSTSLDPPQILLLSSAHTHMVLLDPLPLAQLEVPQLHASKHKDAPQAFLLGGDAITDHHLTIMRISSSG